MSHCGRGSGMQFLMILSYCGENEKMWLVADQKLICLVLCCMNQEVA
jgi:hypothetical protein